MTKTMILDMKRNGITIQQLASTLQVSVPVLMHHLNYPSPQGIALIRQALSFLKSNPTENQIARANHAQDALNFINSSLPDEDEGYFYKVGTGTPLDNMKEALFIS